MGKFRMLFFAALGILASGVVTFAQAPSPSPFKTLAEAAANDTHVLPYRSIAAGIGFAIAVFGGAIGQSRVAASACEGAARNPGASGRIQIMMILGLALIESLVLFALVVQFAKV